MNQHLVFIKTADSVCIQYNPFKQAEVSYDDWTEEADTTIWYSDLDEYVAKNYHMVWVGVHQFQGYRAIAESKDTLWLTPDNQISDKGPNIDRRKLAHDSYVPILIKHCK